ncbi:hypothetical protein [Paractinoplanes hotanensis]|uniref:Uncharacterized protein n=1 Tax=Paractinoplanes hotanensis TaxID=2906497 RepID=A0ABT0YAG1_9ACTN|nr:hypothetical protein [Actinoplanes hotanensis]MCM4082294.1 hypothetical protein [Actinoplanes hotanensis]
MNIVVIGGTGTGGRGLVTARARRRPGVWCRWPALTRWRWTRRAGDRRGHRPPATGQRVSVITDPEVPLFLGAKLTDRVLS